MLVVGFVIRRRYGRAVRLVRAVRRMLGDLIVGVAVRERQSRHR